MFGPDPQQPINIKHADSPEPGDYWSEMYCPIARVLMVDGKRVLVQKLGGYGGKPIDVKDPKPTLMTRTRFAKWLRYDTMPDKTWATVTPNKFR